MTEDEKKVIESENFQSVLKELLSVYRPLLKENLKRAESPDDLRKEAEAVTASCDDEVTLANRIFEPFVTETMARRLLPARALELLGPFEQWRWCLLHIRCCIAFGWLLCRGPRTFRAFVYYLFRYWKCVRQVLGTPVHDPPTAEEHHDFQTLASALAEAYRPYLRDQLSSLDSVASLPDEVFGGKLDCHEGEQDAAAIFERLLTVDTAPALLGAAQFDAHSHAQFFWFCRCWCLCSIRFGCCLARARNLLDVLRCLVGYFLCLRDCFRPLTCEIIAPDGCVEEKPIPAAGIFRGVEIRGTATGVSCDHYILEWRPGFGAWRNTGISYPGGAAQGACGVVNGTLGYLRTFPFVAGGLVEIRLCVFSSQPGTAPCCTVKQFQLQKDEVWIRSVEHIEAPDLFDPSSPLTDGAGDVRSFGHGFRVFGSAVVGGCENSEIKRYTLSYHAGFVVNPTLPGFTQFWQVDYLTAMQLDAGSNRVSEGVLTSSWRQPNLPPAVCNPFVDFLTEDYWLNLVPQAFPLTPSEFPCPAPPTWITSPVPLINCSSGRYTLRLTTEDTGGGIKHHLRQVWIDNKQITPAHAHISQLAGIDPCSNIDLRQFAPRGGSCAVPWPANLLGVAYDELIEEGNLTAPSNNFGGYSLWIKKDGAPDPGVQIPLPGPGAPPWGGTFVSTTRVGDPGTRCVNALPPAGVIPALTDGILAVLDMRRLDAVCNPGEPALTLRRGECCGYVVTLLVWDNSICPLLSGGHHELRHTFPLCICNNVGSDQ